MGPVALALLVACGTAADRSEGEEARATEVEATQEALGAAASNKGADAPEAPASSQLTVLFTNNVDGEIEPCG